LIARKANSVTLTTNHAVGFVTLTYKVIISINQVVKTHRSTKHSST